MCDADLGAARERVPFFPLLPPFGVKKEAPRKVFAAAVATASSFLHVLAMKEVINN
jgi:hypothetical protein